MLVHCRQDGPDKAAELSGHGSDGNMTMFTLVQTYELSVKSMLGLESNRNDGRGLSLPSSV